MRGRGWRYRDQGGGLGQSWGGGGRGEESSRESYKVGLIGLGVGGSGRVSGLGQGGLREVPTKRSRDFLLGWKADPGIALLVIF